MNPRIDKNQIRNYLTLRYNPLEKPSMPYATWKDFQGMVSDPSGIKTQKLLERSILNLLSRKNGTIVIGLSSGIDSSLSLGLIRKVFPNREIVAINAVFEGEFNESKIAEKIAKKFGAHFKILKMDSTFSTLPTLVGISKKPRWNNYQHLVAKEAQKYGRILFFGDGADEIFGGYTFRYEKFMNLLGRNDNWKSRVIKYLECHNRDWVPDQNLLFGKGIKFDWDVIYNYLKPNFNNNLKPLEQVMLADYNGKLLLDFIPTNKQIYQQYGIDGNSIFLDKNVISFARHLSLSQKYSLKNKLGKLVLRKIAKRIEIEHITEKKGFSPDLFNDWNIHGKKICENFLNEKECHVVRKKLINPEWILKAFEKVENDGDVRYLSKLISVLALEIWYKIFITKEMKVADRIF